VAALRLVCRWWLIVGRTDAVCAAGQGVDQCRRARSVSARASGRSPALRGKWRGRRGGAVSQEGAELEGNRGCPKFRE